MPLASVLLAAAACAHVDTVSFAHFVLGREEIELVLEVDADHLMQVVEAKPPLGEDWSDEDVRAIEPVALAYLQSRWQLRVNQLPEAWRPLGFERLLAFDPMIGQERAVRIAFRFALAAPRRDAQASVWQNLFEGVELGHRHVVVLELPDRPPAELFVPGGTAVAFTLPDVGPGATARRLRTRALEGAFTAFAAPWLLLFLAALLVAPLAARERAQSAAAAAAAALAAFALVRAEWIAPAPWAATAAAALSVAYVAAENRFSREVKLRTVTAALFGIVHGMALAPQLRPGLIGATPIETAAFAAAALTVAFAVALALALLTRLAHAFARRAAPFVVDTTLVLAGTAGVVLAVTNR